MDDEGGFEGIAKELKEENPPATGDGSIGGDFVVWFGFGLGIENELVVEPLGSDRGGCCVAKGLVACAVEVVAVGMNFLPEDGRANPFEGALAVGAGVEVEFEEIECFDEDDFFGGDEVEVGSESWAC